MCVFGVYSISSALDSSACEMKRIMWKMLGKHVISSSRQFDNESNSEEVKRDKEMERGMQTYINASKIYPNI